MPRVVQMDIINEYKRTKPIYEFIKRVYDIILCIIASVIAIPIMLIACSLVVLESKGNPIYAQERLGKDEKPFTLYKIRSMCINAEINGPQWTDKNDFRIKKVGKFIRKARIDELPQLFNILKGDMNIVGPRPERKIFTYQFEEAIPGFIKRLQIKPGLTGLAQVNGGYEITPAEKLKWDLIYIKERNLLKDAKIMFKTVSVVVTGHGAR